ncbi:MAG: tRNA 2-thiocytidine(32) synthetase TtcA [Gammaproteobacteria bacterium]|nr:tRNA 2-thiocytidine(32) synthetase TtcA [Gammaproteobacteria bacterium]
MPGNQQKARIDQIKLEKRLRRSAGQAIDDYNMIQNGDRIMVCVSGGKDSYTMLDLLLSLRRNAPIDFELVAVNLDQKQPGFPAHVLRDYLSSLDIPFEILEQDTYSVVKRVIPEGKTQCSLCSRLRRGALYTFAKKRGFTKIALGHHREDIMETFFMNLFHGGTLKTMPAKLKSDDGDNIVIRPLVYCREQDIERYAAIKNFPIIPCDLCGNQENLQRLQTKQLLRDWQHRFPGRVENIFRGLQNVTTSHLLDTSLFDFAGLEGGRAGSTTARFHLHSA